MLVMAGGAAHAGGIVTKHQSSLQHSVEAGYNSYTRMGNSYSISGTNVTTSHTPAASGSSAVSTVLVLTVMIQVQVLQASDQSQEPRQEQDPSHSVSHSLKVMLQDLILMKHCSVTKSTTLVVLQDLLLLVLLLTHTLITLTGTNTAGTTTRSVC